MGLINKFVDFFNAFCERKLIGYSIDQYIIMIIVASIFLPFYYSLIALIIMIFYLIYTKQLKSVVQNTPKGYVALLFGLYSLIVCLCTQNLLGTAQTIGMIAISIFIMYYRKHVDERLFTFIVDTCCLLSILCFIYGVLEYVTIVERLGNLFTDFVIDDHPNNRVESMFFNANYYAMMIQFLVLLCVYKILHAKTLHRIVFYTTTIICNLFSLYLTGCRVGWLSFLITLPLMFYMNSWKKTSYAMIGMIGFAGLVLFMNPEFFPRIDSIFEDFAKRGKIWLTAIKAIAAYPIFGLGPSGYYLIYDKFNGHPTYHCHSIYLDPFLSFGIVGVTMASVFIIPVIKEVIYMFKNKLNPELSGLIASFFVVIFVHGIFDHTAYWIQTGVVFLLVINACCMYKKSNVVEE